MRRTMLTLTICILLLSAATATAQQDPNDLGAMDSILVDFPVFPDVATGETHLRMDLYLFNDAQDLGFTSTGFKWVNSNLQMDSAVVTQLAIDSWEYFRFVYRNNILDSTNVYQVFQFGAGRVMGTGLIASSSPQLVASYYFTVSDWTVNDSIIIDTTVFSSGTVMKFTDVTGKPYVPYWGGKRVLRDTSFVAPSNLVVPADTLHFTGIEGGTDPGPQMFDIDSDFDPLTFSLIESAGWMAPSPTGGTTPTTITVNVTTLGLTEGVYFDSIRVQSSGAVNSPQYVYVELDVTPPPPVIGVSANSFDFLAQEGGANPASQTLTIVNAGGQTLSWTVTNSKSWLSLNPTLGFDEGDVTLSVDITGLMFGEYRDTVYISAPGAANTPVMVPVNLTVGTDLPVIDVDSVIYWPVARSELPIFFRSFEVRNGGEGSLDFWVVESSPIIKEVIPDSSSAPDSITLSLGLLESSVPSGETTFVAQIYSNDAINSPYLVRFRLKLVDEPAVIALSDTLVEFNMYPCAQGYGNGPDSARVMITNDGGDDPMLVTGTHSTELITTQYNEVPATAPIALKIKPVGVDIPPGIYYDTIVIRSKWAANSPQYIVVQYNLLTPTNDPLIHLERPEIKIPWRENSGAVLVDGPDIYNEYGGCMSWQMTESIPWLAPQATSGEVPGLADLVVNPLGYTFGEYVGTIQVTSPDATNSPQDVTVRLQVWKLVGDLNWDGQIDIEDLQWLIGYLFLSMDVPPRPTLVVADTNCDGLVDIEDVQILVDHLFLNLTPICTNP